MATNTRERDDFHMRRALALAQHGWGRVAPNPLVGAVVVRDDEIVGEGYHAEWGGVHAEVRAIEAAEGRASGATLYVTLEPCHHSGKTGPCSRAIEAAGIARVVFATAETNPEARGGAEWLRRRRIQVEEGVCALEALDLNAVHFNSLRHQRPYLALKYALSLDARLAEVPGTMSRVTDGEAQVEAHRLRAGHDAVMVGIGTVLADDPRLTVREWRAPRLPTRRVVLDTMLRLPGDSALVRTAAEAPVWVFAAEDAPETRAERLRGEGVDVLRVRRSPASPRLDLEAVLAELWGRGVSSVLCEGGGSLGSALLAEGRVDRLYAFIAPRLYGEPGVSGFQGGRGLAARDWRLISRHSLGAVTLLTLAPESPADPG
ncbi:MAG: bifunctional diaminohydroxyphosphoribosylaminopyrimidine deaminase/5-amino-6-(5-phosphoribosylamino)uracil reductase RibD [Gemmatimonadota bacterium]|nr:MAG: bifunctional diaminohydroxyphosphoribosylaminopyrimidine deaminase/5-amino-6-(5-phosphoribosylamino)uracil reductase RibD [Gemmatimonadota bacterium]